MVFIQTRPSEILGPLLHLSTPHAPTPRIHFLQRFGLACTFFLPSTYPAGPTTGVFGHSQAHPGLSSHFSTDPRVSERVLHWGYTVFTLARVVELSKDEDMSAKLENVHEFLRWSYSNFTPNDSYVEWKLEISRRESRQSKQCFCFSQAEVSMVEDEVEAGEQCIQRVSWLKSPTSRRYYPIFFGWWIR